MFCGTTLENVEKLNKSSVDGTPIKYCNEIEIIVDGSLPFYLKFVEKQHFFVVELITKVSNAWY